jgi:predicted nucleic acid-binding protein
MRGPQALVIDASIAISIVRKEPEGSPAAALIAERARDGARIVVPTHFWLEVSSGLLVGHRWSGALVLEAIYELDRLELETVDLDRPSVVLAIDVSERHRLTMYDATYLALAITLDASIATFDHALGAAAGPRLSNLGGRRLSGAPAAYEHRVTWPSYRGASAYLAKLRAEAASPR